MTTPESTEPVKTPWLHLALVALVASLDAVVRLGRIHPDEVFQMLEPALFKLYGFGVVAWEWDVNQGGGIRNWAFPGIVMGCLKFCDLVGVADVWFRRVVIEVPQYFLHLAMLAAVFRFSLRRVGAKLALACVWLVGLYAPIVWFAGRTTTESLSVPFLIIALERLDLRPAKWHVPAVAGLMLGLAEIFRYGSAAVILFVLVGLLLARRFRDLAFVALGGALAAGALAALDMSTWGFLSLPKYLDFNVFSGRAAAQFGEQLLENDKLPEWLRKYGWYLPRFIIAPWAVLGFWRWAKDKSLRAWLPVFAAVGYFAVISRTPHKEARFMYPTLALLVFAAAPAFVRWASEAFKAKARVAQGFALVGLIGAFVYFPVETPLDVERPAQFQFTIEAGRTGHGLLLVNEGMWGSGGYFYLGKNMPFTMCDFAQDGRFQQAMAMPVFDRVITWDDRELDALLKAGFTVKESKGRGKLLTRPFTQ